MDDAIYQSNLFEKYYECCNNIHHVQGKDQMTMCLYTIVGFFLCEQMINNITVVK